MDEYISRKSVTVGLDYIINELNKLITNDGYTDIKNQVEEIKRGVLNIPPEDVQPVVHGEWIDYTEDGYVECPYCHSATNCDGNSDELHYCFSCGAKMDGKGAGE